MRQKISLSGKEVKRTLFRGLKNVPNFRTIVAGEKNRNETEDRRVER